jgi:hypothetical protein
MRAPPSSFTAAVLVAALAGCGGGGGGGHEDSSGTTTTSTGTGAPSKVTKGKGPDGATTIEFDEGALEEASVRASIEDVLTSSDPKVACGEEATDALIRNSYGDRQACVLAQKPGSAASAVSVKTIQIAGEKATALAIPSGGPSDGDRITVSLVFADGVWKVDALKSDAPVGP